MNILAIGDVVSKPGLDTLRRLLRTLKKQYAIDFTIVNGENASGVGITPDQADDILMPVPMSSRWAITFTISARSSRIWTTARTSCVRLITHPSSQDVAGASMIARATACSS